MATAKNPLFSNQRKKPSKKVATLQQAATPPWKILIVDDEPEVHTVTQLVLQDFELMGRGIELHNAYSASEAKTMLQNNHNYALALIDVVMETDEAGLELVKYIRETLEDHHIRLILRTGQPGFAPEKDVIRDYDINDYKDKTELTETKLHTVLCSAFRSYEDIILLDKNRQGLERVIAASASIFDTHSLQSFSIAALEQLTSHISGSHNKDLSDAAGFSAFTHKNAMTFFATSGRFSTKDNNSDNALTDHIKNLQHLAKTQQHSIYEKDHLMLFSQTQQGQQHFLYLHHNCDINPQDESLIDLFASNLSIAFENHTLRAEIEETQREIVCILGEAIENRSKESGNHIHRVAEMTGIMARAYGYNEDDVERIIAAAPLHDVGKVAIPDDVLHKPGKLIDGEWDTMKTHVDIGYDLLKNSNRKILAFAAVIAHEHHERWDGKGYPQGLAGEDIHILGRIVALVDVFDALANKRCYKDAWPIDKAVDFIKEGAGSQFDPNVVHLFMQNQQQLQVVCQRFSDQAH